MLLAVQSNTRTYIRLHMINIAGSLGDGFEGG